MSEQQSLAELIRTDAPVNPRRALAVALSLVDELIDLSRRGRKVTGFRPDQVWLSGDGSVSFDVDICSAARETATASPSESAASVGAVLFELLMARAPISSADAFEPAITSSLPPTLAALIVRSVSDSAGQWPTLDLWADALGAAIGGGAVPTPPIRVRRDRRRAFVAVALLAVLAAITVIVVTLAPGWWNSATTDEGSLTDQSSLAAS